MTLKVKFADFEIITRSRSVSTAIANREDLAQLAIGLLEDAMPLPKAVRLLGVSLSSLQSESDTDSQLDFGVRIEPAQRFQDIRNSLVFGCAP